MHRLPLSEHPGKGSTHLGHTEKSAGIGTWIGLGLGVVSIGTAAIVIRWCAEIGALEIAAGRLVVTGLGWTAISPGACWRSASLLIRDRRLLWRTALASLLLGVHFLSWTRSLERTSVVHSVVLVSSMPVFAAGFGLFLGDRAPRGFFWGTGIAAAGAVIMASAHAENAASAALTGDLLATVAAAAAAGYLVVGRAVGQALPLSGYLALVNLAAALGLEAYAHAAGSLQPQHWSYTAVAGVLYLGLVPGLVGHGLLNAAVRRLPAHTVTLATLAEPLVATALAWLLLGEPVSGRELLGAAALLGGVVLALLATSARSGGRQTQ